MTLYLGRIVFQARSVWLTLIDLLWHLVELGGLILGGARLAPKAARRFDEVTRRLRAA